MNKPHLSIVIPAYNEEARLPAYLGAIIAYLKPLQLPYEILIVDDGSTDGTGNIARSFARDNSRVKLVRLPVNSGKGFAVRTGMLRAAGDLILFTDADGSTPIAELGRLRAAIERGADIAIASRALDDADTVVTARAHRKFIGTVFNCLVTLLAVRGIRDTQCGFKLFTAAAAAKIFPLQRINDFGFDVEILFISRKRGCRVDEVPVEWADVKGSKVSLFKDSAAMFTDIFRVRMNSLLGLYDLPVPVTSMEGRIEG